MTTTIGGYPLIRPLGAGGMAKVYEARHPQHGRVAVKLLADHAADPEDRRRFLREVEVVRALSHPNIITIYDAGDAGGRPFIAMELIEGGSLEARLHQHGPLAVDQAVPIVLAVLDALEHAHQRGLVHRDIKPANVLVRPDGTPVLADFDLARQQRPDPRTRITTDGDLLGTPAYMAPEQLRGDELDARTDLYACGAMLFELLTGRAPFEGDVTAVIVGHLQQPAPRLRDLAPQVPAALDRLVGTLLAKDPASRPPDAAEAARLLRAAVSAPLPATGPTTVLQAPRVPVPAASPQPISPVMGGAMAVGLISGFVLFIVLAFVLILGVNKTEEGTSLLSATAPAADTSPTAQVIVTIETTIDVSGVGPGDGLAGIAPPRIVDAPLTSPQPVLDQEGTPFTVGSVGLMGLDERVAIFYAEIRNDGQSPRAVGLVSADLIGADGSTLGKALGAPHQSLLKPGEIGTVVVVFMGENTISVSQVAETRFAIESQPAPAGRAPELGIVGVEAATVQPARADVVETIQVQGTLRNTGDRAVQDVRVGLVLYDSAGRVTMVDDQQVQLPGGLLQPGESAAFEVSTLALGGTSASYRLYTVATPDS